MLVGFYFIMKPETKPKHYDIASPSITPEQKLAAINDGEDKVKETTIEKFHALITSLYRMYGESSRQEIADALIFIYPQNKTKYESILLFTQAFNKSKKSFYRKTAPLEGEKRIYGDLALFTHPD